MHKFIVAATGNPQKMIGPKKIASTPHKFAACISLVLVQLLISGPLQASSSEVLLTGVLPVWSAEESADQSQGAASLDPERIHYHLADPETGRDLIALGLENARQKGDRTREIEIQRIVEHVEAIRRPDRQIRLSLEEVIQRTLENSYLIDVQRYNPAVETTRVIEAQSTFDAVFFTNITKDRDDSPTGSQLFASDLDFFQLSTGIRKLLPSGMQASTSYQLRRSKTTLRFQDINPEYVSTFVAELRQPLLRGFGFDYNRSLIRVAQNNDRISCWAFRRQVRDTVRQVEELYWRLFQARRDAAITARLLAEFETIYDQLYARKDFDILPVQLAATRANLEQTRADFIQVLANVRDAEDRLIAAMNDSELDLADDIEIIPTDLPFLDHFLVDRIAEAQMALENRAEIKEQQLRVANAKIGVGRAKIEELPRLDLTFRSTFDGLAGTADRSFDELSRSKYIQYTVGVEFEVPIGNRGPRAAHRRARLQHSQAVAQLKATLEDIILDVNLSVRSLNTTFDRIAPSFESADARKREIDSLVARQERKDVNTLNSELGARQSLAAARRSLLNALVEYNLAIIDLERAKGTLLQYNNIIIPGDKE